MTTHSTKIDALGLPANAVDLLKPPEGWSQPFESDIFANRLEILLPQIRRHAAQTDPAQQKSIDDAILAHLDISYAYFGETNLHALAVARAELLQDILQRKYPDLPLHIEKAHSGSNKIKLGIIVRYFKPFIDNWVLAGFLTSLPHDTYDITLYSVQDIDQRIDQEKPEQKKFHAEFTKLVDRYKSLDTLPLTETVQAIRKDKNDIILLGNAMHTGTGKAHLLQAYRLAPIEIVTTNTPSSCGFTAVDYYMSAKNTEPKDAQAHYSEKIVWLPDQSFAMALDPVPEFAAAYKRDPEDDAWLAQQGILPNTPILVNCSAWPKLTVECITLWAEILQAAPEAHLILDPHSPSWSSDTFAHAQRRTISGILSAHNVEMARCHILDMYPSNKTFAVLDRATLYLDAFPYSGNMALREALLMGCPIVTRTTNHQRGMQAAALLHSIGMHQLVTADNESYKSLVIELLQNKPTCMQLRARIKSAMKSAPIYDSTTLSLAFSDLLKNLMENEKSS